MRRYSRSPGASARPSSWTSHRRFSGTTCTATPHASSSTGWIARSGDTTTLLHGSGGAAPYLEDPRLSSLVGKGAPFEVEDVTVDGVRLRSFVRAPRTVV